MIHHFARALAVREQARSQAAMRPARAATDTPPAACGAAARPTPAPAARGLSIRRDPNDARRTVIAGRFAEVCAALDRMAAELEAA